MTRRGSTFYDSPPSRIPDHIFERWQQEDSKAGPVQTEAELREEIVTLKEQVAKLEKIARDALEALSDYDGWLTREEGRHGDAPVQPPHFGLVK